MKHWFITGVSSGIGEALAEAALARGDSVVGTVRKPEQIAAFETLAPGRAHGLALDVDKAEQIGPAVQRAISLAGGRIDIAVNNAGRSLFGAVEEITLDEARALFATNVFAPLAVMQALLPHFREAGGGTFINISSGVGLTASPGIGIYSASKFALEGLSEAAAMEVAGFGVRVMLVEPGAVNSRFISHGTSETAKRLPAYAMISGHGKDVLNAYYGERAASPGSVAADILAALDRPELPLRLILSDDVRGAVRAKCTALIELTQGAN